MKKKDLINEIISNASELEEATFSVDPKNTQNGDMDKQIADIQMRSDYDPNNDKIEVNPKTEGKVYKKSQIMEMKRQKLYENTTRISKKDLLKKL